MSVEALWKARQRVDRSGQARMSTGSVTLLMKLACGEGKWTPWKILAPFVASIHITELDLLPLEEKGWVERKCGREGSLIIRITDAGNEMVRGLVGWLDGQDKGVAGNSDEETRRLEDVEKLMHLNENEWLRGVVLRAGTYMNRPPGEGTSDEYVAVARELSEAAEFIRTGKKGVAR